MAISPRDSRGTADRNLYMDANDLRTMLDYDCWARTRMLSAVATLSAEQYTRAMGNSFGSVRDTVVHIYGADRIWAARYIGGASPTGFPTPESLPDVAAVHAAWTELDARVSQFAAALDDAGVNRIVAYENLAGASFATPLRQIIHHVTNHATYHRGQVTTMLRQLGAAPPESMDLIAYYRAKAG